MKDRFWRIFAIVALIVTLGIFVAWGFMTRYVARDGYVLDRWTGKTTLIQKQEHYEPLGF